MAATDVLVLFVRDPVDDAPADAVTPRLRGLPERAGSRTRGAASRDGISGPPR